VFPYILPLIARVVCAGVDGFIKFEFVVSLNLMKVIEAKEKAEMTRLGVVNSLTLKLIAMSKDKPNSNKFVRVNKPTKRRQKLTKGC